MKEYLKIARPDHWVKNIFIVPGIITALLLVENSWGNFPAAIIVIGFFATCLIASANYVINEWLDAEFDQFHPTKKVRPVVGGSLKLKYVILEYGLLAAGGLLLSLAVNWHFVLMEAWLLVMGILYNVKPFRTKDIIFLDVLSESVNNLIRFMIGWFMITTKFLPPSSILLGYWMVGAFLMATKRLAEYRMINDPGTAGAYRKSFRYYTEKTLFGSAFFYALCATFCIGVFLIKYRVEYVLTMPIMFIVFAYYIMLAFAEDSVVQKPEKLYKAKLLIGLVLLFVVSFLAMTFINVPGLHELTSSDLIHLL